MSLTEDPLVVDVFDAVPQADRVGKHQDVQVEEEAEPGGRLVLRHRRDDGNVDLGVARVPQRVEPGGGTERASGSSHEAT